MNDERSRPRRIRPGRHLLIAAAALTGALLTACRPDVPLEGLRATDIETTVFLIGDAGEPDPRTGGMVLDSLSVQLRDAPERSWVLFLGDNVYPDGIPEEGAAEWADARRRLAAQVRAIPMGATGVFIPGNHDWADDGPFGLYALRLQEDMLADLADGRNVLMAPSNGCPGPTVFDVGRLRMIAIDTQWWLHPYIVRDAETDCDATIPGFMAGLRTALAPARSDQVTILAAHHPLMTGGEHGGYCGIAGPFHRFGGRRQDIMSSANRTMRDSLEVAMRVNPPLIYAAGHEHNMQVLRGGEVSTVQLVSGAGAQSKVGCAVRLRESYYVSQHRVGFMRIDVLRSGGVLLRVFRYKSDGTGGLSYSRWLEPLA